MHAQDKAYRALFSHPRLVEDLIRTFVKGKFTRRIDFSTLKKLDRHFVSDEYIEREADLIYEVRFKQDPVFFYLLIEFQSEPDRFMALRMLTYILLFYQDMVKQRKLSQLPTVFPILLFSGDRKWNAPERLEELVEISDPSVQSYIPRFKYYKILENEFSRSSLEKLDSISAAMFLIENADHSSIIAATHQLINVLEHESDREMKREFLRWIRSKFSKMNVEVKSNSLERIKEELPMFETRIMREFEQVKLEGKLEGMLEGKLEGKLEGMHEGKLEGKLEAKLEDARNMLAHGLEIEFVSKITGLSIEEINEAPKN